jgi:hypothetical protein
VPGGWGGGNESKVNKGPPTTSYTSYNHLEERPHQQKAVCHIPSDRCQHLFYITLSFVLIIQSVTRVTSSFDQPVVDAHTIQSMCSLYLRRPLKITDLLKSSKKYY